MLRNLSGLLCLHIIGLLIAISFNYASNCSPKLLSILHCLPCSHDMRLKLKVNLDVTGGEVSFLFSLELNKMLVLSDRVSMSTSNEPRSSRLKDKKRGEGEMMVKELFVKDVTENNDLLHNLLEKGSSCVLLPRDSLDISLCSNSRIGSQIMVKPRPSLGLCSPEEALEASGSVLCEDAVLDRNMRFRHLNGLCQRKRIPSVKYGQYASDFLYASTSDSQNMESEKEGASQVDGLLDQGLFSCVTCGILSFACVAVIQPTEAAAGYLMSADCNPFGDQIVGLGATNDQIYNVTDVCKNNSDMDTHSGRLQLIFDTCFALDTCI